MTQSDNSKFQGFERPSDEVLELTISSGFVPMPAALWTVLRQQANPTTIKLVAVLLRRILISRELERVFNVDYPDIAQDLVLNVETVRVSLREAVERGYLKMIAKGVRENPTRYAINWKETMTAAAEK